MPNEIKSRSQAVQHTQIVGLHALFRDGSGNPVDLDTFPTITIIQSNGNVSLGPTSQGVYRVSAGLYGYNYQIGLTSPVGIWTDTWAGNLIGVPVRGEFNFVVFDSDLPAAPNSDGYVNLGDDPGFDYTQDEIRNINSLLKTLKARLANDGKAKVKDKFGNDQYITCSVFDVTMLTSFLAESITRFNQLPFYTSFSFSDTDFISEFHSILVQGATLMALSSKMLLERGREYNIVDNSLSFTPPTVSELMNTSWGTELSNYFETLKLIKLSLRPSPLGLGSLSITNGGINSVVRSLRLRRERQVF